MILITVLINLWAANASFATSCGPIILAHGDRLSVAMHDILPVYPGDEARFQLLDQALIARIRTSFDALPETRRDEFLSVIERPIWRWHSTGFSGATEGTGSPTAMLEIKADNVSLILGQETKFSEIHRRFVVHELTHLFDFLGKSALVDLPDFVYLARRRRLGVYRIEVPARRADYRWIRDRYTANDVVRLKALAPDEDEWTKDLPDVDSDPTEAAIEATRDHVVHLASRAVDAIYADDVRDALTISEADYVTDRIAADRTEQMLMTFRVRDRAWTALALWHTYRRPVQVSTGAAVLGALVWLSWGFRFP